VTVRYLLDTNVVSEPLRPVPEAGVLRRLREHDSEMAIPTLVWHEMRFGCARLPASKRRTAIERYLMEVVLPGFPMLPYDQPAAEWHALERAHLVAAGHAPPFVDGQIAAIARVNDLELVTRNRADFRQFRGLKVRSWA